MQQNDLRKQIKMIKALQGISYKEISEYLEITPNSLYNYLRGAYDLSDDKAARLEDILSNLWEGDI